MSSSKRYIYVQPDPLEEFQDFLYDLQVSLIEHFCPEEFDSMDYKFPGGIEQ